MAEPVHAPWIVSWIAKVLTSLPSPTESWAAIIDSLAWPVVTMIIIFRFRRFIRHYLWVIADRLERDHVKLGWFEIRANDQVTVLDPSESGESTLEFSPDDIARIEAMFEFIGDAGNFTKLEAWVNQTFAGSLDIESFLTMPGYASERKQAFSEVEGLAE